MLMKKNLFRVITALMFILLSLTNYSCYGGRYLKTESANSGEITGTYTLILYGGNYANDKKTLAILAKEGTQNTFDVFAPEFDYKIIKGVPARDALKKAEYFVRFHHDFWKSQLSKIIDKQGNVIGYEIRPLYYPMIYGNPDILHVYYKKTDGKTIVYIRLYQNLETMPFEDGGGSRHK